jgi:hypothetical protein
MSAQEALSASLRPPHGLSLPGPVWGLDPSTHRLSAGIVCMPGDTFHWQTCSYSQAGTMEARLARGLGDLLRFFVQLRDECGGRPHGIFLEEPFGGMERFNPATKKKELVKPHPNAFYFVGLVRCALGHLFAEPEVQLIGPPSWKSKALGEGHGFAKKPEIMQWAQEIGYTGMLEDEADAIGIATAGAVILSAS